ncbi:MAG: glycoside hydrolase family 15 protein [Acidimicrobiales bacterium]
MSNGRSLALLTPDATIDWLCAPRFDSTPALWSLLQPDIGGQAAWEQSRMTRVHGPPAGATAVTDLITGDGHRFNCRDALLLIDDTTVMVRMVRAQGAPVTLTHCLTVAALPADGQASAEAMWVKGGHTVIDPPGTHRTSLHASSQEWTPLWIGFAGPVGDQADGPADGPAEIDSSVGVALLEQAECWDRRRLASALLPRTHPGRAADALAVIEACTYCPTGAVIAAATTSLPESPDGHRRWDYRFSWLRDASLGVSVAALLGQRQAAREYLRFVGQVIADHGVPGLPATDVDGRRVPAERAVRTRDLGGDPIHLGNEAGGQIQYDGLGLVTEAISVYLQTGGNLDDQTWQVVRSVADYLARNDPVDSNGIWEFRHPRRLVSADIGRWLALQRASTIARWRPLEGLGPARLWRRAAATSRQRVLDALGPDGSLPQFYGQDPPVPDASALMVAVFGLMPRSDPRLGKLVDWILPRLDAWPWLYRYPPGSDGMPGTEGAFIPVSWWAVDALAYLGRIDDARERATAMLDAFPGLISEEIDPNTGAALGNVPLVWSHAELARTLYLFDALDRRERWGSAGLWAWRLARYAQLRWGRSGEAQVDDGSESPAQTGPGGCGSKR